MIRHLLVNIRIHLCRGFAFQQPSLIQLQQRQRHLEQKRRAVVEAEEHVPDAE